MLAHEIRDLVAPLLRRMGAGSPLLDALNRLSAIRERVLAAVDKALDLENSNDYSAARKALAEAVTSIKAMNLYLFYSELNSLEIAAAKLPIFDEGERAGLPVEIRDFTGTLQQCLISYSSSATFNLLEASVGFRAAILVAHDLLLRMQTALYANPMATAEHGRFTLTLSSTPTFQGLALKLQALAGLYDELARLLNISVSEYPLQIIKVESGSLFVDLSGSPQVIAFMTSLIDRAFTWAYRTFTTRGKIEELPHDVALADSILNVAQKLEEQGTPADKSREAVAISLVIITQRLNTLMANESRIKLNDIEHAIPPSFEHRFIAASNQRLLSTRPSDAVVKTEESGER